MAVAYLKLKPWNLCPLDNLERHPDRICCEEEPRQNADLRAGRDQGG